MLTPEDTKIFDMKKNLCLIFISIVLAACASSGRKLSDEDVLRYASLSTYEVTSEQVTCKKNWLGRYICKYEIGKDLEIKIEGVGVVGAWVHVVRSIGKQGDFYPSLNNKVGCITIHRGIIGNNEKDLTALTDLAFISTLDGRVYETWKECKALVRGKYY